MIAVWATKHNAYPVDIPPAHFFHRRDLVCDSSGTAPFAARCNNDRRSTAADEHVLQQFFGSFSCAVPRRGTCRHRSYPVCVKSHQHQCTQTCSEWPSGARHVDTVSAKYFGRTVRRHQSVGIRCADSKWEGGRSGCYQNGYYIFDFSDGEAFAFSQIVRLIEIGDRRYIAYVNVYRPSLDFEGDPHGTVEGWRRGGHEVELIGRMRATLRRDQADGRDRFRLLSYTVSP